MRIRAVTPAAARPDVRLQSRRIWRHSHWDALLVALAVGHGLLLVLAPSPWLIAIGLWWNANTIAHNFIHRPFFRSRAGNRAFSAYLSLLLGLPHSLWRARHLAHHAEDARQTVATTPRTATEAAPRHLRVSRSDVSAWLERVLVLTFWTTLVLIAPVFVLRVYLPGWSLGLCLCLLQGHFEHARGTTSHYGRLYNLLFFNDGYHVEHHRQPGLHWRNLSASARLDRQSSRWPPVLRWLEPATRTMTVLNGLERLVLRSAWLQSRVIAVHERAFRTVLRGTAPPGRIAIIGGGLFPRSALILRRCFPAATITIIDADARHIDRARSRLDACVRWQVGLYETGTRLEADLIVVPLAFIGNRGQLYAAPPAPTVLVHDWWWRKRGDSVSISALLLKRLNAIRAPHA